MPKHEFVFDPVTMKMPHPIYEATGLPDVKVSAYEPKGKGDRWARFLVSLMRIFFDRFTRYDNASMNEQRWFGRVIFLETVAGVPGFVGGMCRHLRSLRTLKRDNGWINHLLAEAENERQHLLTFMHQRNPGWLFRFFVMAGQGIFMNMYFVSYMIAPMTCHRFVGYLEEQAVKTYTHFLHDIDHGSMKEWGSSLCTLEARQYWQLGEGATWRDVVLAIRADEAVHRDFNHYLADHRQADLNKTHKEVIVKSPWNKLYKGNDPYNH